MKKLTKNIFSVFIAFIFIGVICRIFWIYNLECDPGIGNWDMAAIPALLSILYVILRFLGTAFLLGYLNDQKEKQRFIVTLFAISPGLFLLALPSISMMSFSFAPGLVLPFAFVIGGGIMVVIPWIIEIACLFTSYLLYRNKWKKLAFWVWALPLIAVLTLSLGIVFIFLKHGLFS